MTVRSVDRALMLLEFVAVHQPIAMPDLRRAFSIPRSSLHELIEALTERQFLSRDSHNRIVMGVRAFEVGSTFVRQIDAVEMAKPILRDLVEEVEQIAHLGLLDGTNVVYLWKEENKSPVQLVSAIGRALSAHATAMGKALLAELSDEELRKLYGEKELERLTPSTIDSLDRLIEELAEIRTRGFATDYEESTPQVVCFSSVVPVPAGNPVAISVSVINLPGCPHPAEFYSDAVCRAARRLSERLGSKAKF